MRRVEGAVRQNPLDVVPILRGVLHAGVSAQYVPRRRPRDLVLHVDAHLTHILLEHVLAGDRAGGVRVLGAVLARVVDAELVVDLRVCAVEAKHGVVRVEVDHLVQLPPVGREALQEQVARDRTRAHPEVHLHLRVRGQVPRQLDDHLALRGRRHQLVADLLGHQHGGNLDVAPEAIIRHDDVVDGLRGDIGVLFVHDDHGMCAELEGLPHLRREGAIPALDENDVDEVGGCLGPIRVFESRQKVVVRAVLRLRAAVD
mmetsp:Transcript_52507/g.152911  ORF Transcript_52507/g.152911 Transcript_52507/m.152911 type:complete len:258 (-) Transcript_52507:206-979(-)